MYIQPGNPQQNDYLNHVLGFAAVVFPNAFLYRHALNWLLASAIVFGGAIELIRPYANRQGELADFWTDVTGAFLGTLIGLLARYLFRTRKLNTPADAR